MVLELIARDGASLTEIFLIWKSDEMVVVAVTRNWSKTSTRLGPIADQG